jgi:replication-associated recombination protein RarA
VIDRDELRAKAEAATPGPWWTGMHDGFSHTVEGPEADSHPVAQRLIRPDAEYIAAASPDVVLDLLDALDAAERAASPSDEEREAAGVEVCRHWISRPRSDAEIEASARAIAVNAGHDAAGCWPTHVHEARAALAAADAVRQEGSKR